MWLKWKFITFPQNDFHLHTRSERSWKCPSCKSKTNFTTIQFQPLCTGNISMPVSTRGHRYLSFINNIHSAAEQKNDFFFTLMGMGCSNLISAMRLTVSSGPKVPFTTSRLFQRWACDTSPFTSVPGCWKKTEKVRGEQTRGDGSAHDDNGSAHEDNGSAHDDNDKLSCRDVSLQQHAPLKKCN